MNDGKRFDEVLGAAVVKRKRTLTHRSKHLRAEARYRSADNPRIIEDHGCTPHVVD